jgi:hypothetical protein
MKWEISFHSKKEKCHQLLMLSIATSNYLERMLRIKMMRWATLNSCKGLQIGATTSFTEITMLIK